MTNFDYPLPIDVQDTWRKLDALGIRAVLNPGLIFDRFLPRWDIEKDHKNVAIKGFPRHTKRADLPLLKAWNLRWEAMVASNHVAPFTLQTDWRFVTGLGAKGSLEVGFNFHRYGFPYLPGSGLKGLARTFALIEIAEKRGTTLLKTLNDAVLSLDNKDAFNEAFADDHLLQTSQPLTAESETLANTFRLIFGTSGSEGQSGQAIFYDAIPDAKALPELVVDIMNPHFSLYYRDSVHHAPTDSQNPIPVFFIAVASGQSFRFATGWRGMLNPPAHTQAQIWLTEALLTLGAGAKTSSGYGYFVRNEDGTGNLGQTNLQGGVANPDEVLVAQLITNIQSMRSDKVVGQIYSYVERWRTFQGSADLKRQLAQAIKAKVETSSGFKSIRKKEWYLQLSRELE